MREGDLAFADIIDMLSKIDAIVDFSRGRTQLEVLLFVCERGECTTEEIISSLRLPRKTAFDVLNRLKRKQLIEHVKRGVYKPSKTGLEIFNFFKSLEIARITKVLTLWDVLLVVGCSLRGEISIKKLSKILSMSEKELVELVRSKKDIFNLEKRKNEYVVSLTSNGYFLLSRLLKSHGIGPITAMVISALTFQPNPFKALKRFILLYLFISFLAAMDMFLFSTLIPILVWFADTIVLSVLFLLKK